MIADTNVIISALEPSSPNHQTARRSIAHYGAEDGLIINKVILAELSGRFESATDVIEIMRTLNIHLKRFSLDDCHRAGVAFRSYRRIGGARTTILPDFLIGAHAESNGWPILTNDRKGFASYFPTVELISPESIEDD